jgi:CDP-paratose 2-epimerase
MKAIITGGAGFIGTNAAAHYLARGSEVVVIDNLARRGSLANLNWLRSRGRVVFAQVDVRDTAMMEKTFRLHRDAAVVLHLAGQVAVTSSVADPRFDFETNAVGTLNVLEAMRRLNLEAPLLYASTNKVYGEMEAEGVVERPTRYDYSKLRFGVSEERVVDFHSPYGCSKGAADQYVRDYHRIYGLNTVVFRQSCVYGTRQFGYEDQGWVAWFLIAAEMGLPITIYGNGKQVRDVLFIDDLLEVFDAAVRNINVARGRIYNVGGGPANALSLVQLLDLIGERRGEPLSISHAPRRPGDQRIYVSDIRRADTELGWQPRIGWREGVGKLHEWVRQNRDECERIFEMSAQPAVAG